MGNLFDNPVFQSIGKDKLAVLKEMMEVGKGKSPMELMDLMVRYGERLSGGRPLKQEEKQALLLAIQESAEPAERKRIDEVIGMLRSMGKI